MIKYKYTEFYIQSNIFFFNQKRMAVISIKNKTFVIEDKCKHRGGPLSLAKKDELAEVLICPWHQISNCVLHLNKKNYPSLIIGNKIKILEKIVI